MTNSFVERLNLVLGDRKQTPWGKSLGFTGGSISSIFGGRIPGPEILNIIRRVENVNLNWLLSGSGSPYSVDYIQSAERLADTVDQLLMDEDWKVYVCNLGARTVLVLSLPGQYESKDKWYDYTICQVLVGPGSEELASVLKASFSEREIYLAEMLAGDVLDQIAEGLLGTYSLLVHEDSHLINFSSRVVVPEQIQYYPRVYMGEGTSYAVPIATDLMRSVVKLVEQCEEESKQNLSADQKARVITAVYRQAEKLGLSEEEISSAIETSFDVLKD
ncbi:transcriptional regulator [Vibrio cholerae]|nr:transcriptional regulator [Vibrio cholerae]